MLHIISNPHSGRGTIRTASLLRRLRRENIPFVLHQSDTQEELTAILHSLTLHQGDPLLLIGGDGSLHTLINQVPLTKLSVLLLLPAGSGNDFARGLHMKRGEDALLSLLKDPRTLLPEYLDCGEVSLPGATERFLVSCGIGYDAGVCDAINHSLLKRTASRLHLSRAAFLLLGIRQAFRYEPFTLRLRTDSGSWKTFHNTAFLSCHNTPYEGGGCPFAPDASARSGELELCVITGRTRLAFFLGIAAAYLGGHHGLLPNVHLIHCRKAEVLSDRPLPFHADGDVTPGVRGFRVRCHPSCVPLLYVSGKD